ncbi:NAD(P)-dependent oxidoreductase [Rhodoligotrophos defluvii]|uniref:NAD(P)-dependent oxidoreductase n=1 Tax=Rhodoligotrophos defluvii TaxID=2561934 RepID=UPI0010CA0795|nr:DUF1932 domain-containing protein [Rhodoligotrophos defluvii]
MTGSIAIIGIGEAGTIFASGFALKAHVRAYDILETSDAFRRRTAGLRAQGIEFLPSLQRAVQGAELVISLVTAAASRDVAEDASKVMCSGQIFLDLNSVSPGTKKESAAALEKAGIHYVDGAVMAPVPPHGLAVPILLAGRRARVIPDMLAGFGMNLKVISDEIGVASATKMCRSVIIKGIEALCAEAFLAARAHGVEDAVLASLRDTFPGTDWHRYAGYQIGRSLVHGRRRAAEMREVASTLREAGVEPAMSLATARRQDWAADVADSDPRLRMRSDEVWLETLDLILKAGTRKPAEADA